MRIVPSKIYLIVILLWACQAPVKQSPDKKLIVTTTGTIADAVKNIVKDSAQVESLMGPGVDPHLYKASHRDVNLLTEADVIFYNGLHLEGKIQTILEKVARQKDVIAVSSSITRQELTTISGTERTYDPHIWFDIHKWKSCVKVIRETLQRADPIHSDYYAQNEHLYQQRLNSLDNYIRTQLQTIPPNQRILITAHDAFGYFGKAYKVQVRGLQGISTLSDFGLKDVSELVEFITQRKIKAIFVETSISPKSIQAVIEGCQARGHQVKIGGNLYSDALGEPGSQAGSYIGMVKSNVNTIVNSLK